MKVFQFILILIQLVNLYECKNIVIISGNKGRWRNHYNPPESEIKDVRFYYVSFNVHGSSYGDTFGSNRLESNTHIYNANYKNYADENKPFLTESLYKNQQQNSKKSELRGWMEPFDRRWRKTTKLPYFANEIPSENKKLPAAVVVGAARAFGLTTLLPLNVPVDQPLIYCPDKNLQQAKIRLDNKLYWCSGHILHVECLKSKRKSGSSSENAEQGNTNTHEITTEISNTEMSTESLNVETLTENLEAETVLENQEMSFAEKNADSTDNLKVNAKDTDFCFDNQIPCNSTIAYVGNDLACKSGTFSSSSKIFCDSVTNQDSGLILNCYFGYLPPHHTSFVPTTEDPTQVNYSIEPDESYIYSAVSFFVDLFSKPSKKKEIPEKTYTYENATDWLPMAFPVDVGY